jgi:hypothetical protein
MTTEQNINSILRFVHLHAPEMVRADGDCVLAAVYCSTDPSNTSVYAGDFCEIVELRTMREARDWLGY